MLPSSWNQERLTWAASAPFSENESRAIIGLGTFRILNSISKALKFSRCQIKTLELKFKHPDRKDFAMSLQMLRDFLKPMQLLTTLRVS